MVAMCLRNHEFWFSCSNRTAVNWVSQFNNSSFRALTANHIDGVSPSVVFENGYLRGMQPEVEFQKAWECFRKDGIAELSTTTSFEALHHATYNNAKKANLAIEHAPCIANAALQTRGEAIVLALASGFCVHSCVQLVLDNDMLTVLEVCHLESSCKGIYNYVSAERRYVVRRVSAYQWASLSEFCHRSHLTYLEYVEDSDNMKCDFEDINELFGFEESSRRRK